MLLDSAPWAPSMRRHLDLVSFQDFLGQAGHRHHSTLDWWQTHLKVLTAKTPEKLPKTQKGKYSWILFQASWLSGVNELLKFGSRSVVCFVCFCELEVTQGLCCVFY